MACLLQDGDTIPNTTIHLALAALSISYIRRTSPLISSCVRQTVCDVFDCIHVAKQLALRFGKIKMASLYTRSYRSRADSRLTCAPDLRTMTATVQEPHTKVLPHTSRGCGCTLTTAKPSRAVVITQQIYTIKKKKRGDNETGGTFECSLHELNENPGRLIRAC